MGRPMPATGASYDTAALPALINIARVYEDFGDRSVSEEIDEAEPLKRRETGTMSADTHQNAGYSDGRGRLR
jgi:hypothetical protein